jgi:hypothetical protein
MDIFGTVITLLAIIALNSIFNQQALAMQRNHLTSRVMVLLRRMTTGLEQSLDQRVCDGIHGKRN